MYVCELYAHDFIHTHTHTHKYIYKQYVCILHVHEYIYMHRHIHISTEIHNLSRQDMYRYVCICVRRYTSLYTCISIHTCLSVSVPSTKMLAGKNTTSRMYVHTHSLYVYICIYIDISVYVHIYSIVW